MIKVGITHGDINGIGYEVILKTLADSRITELCTPVIYGSLKLALAHRKIMNLQQIQFNQIPSTKNIAHNKVNIINCVEDNIRIEMGESTPAAGLAAFQSLERATEDLRRGFIDVLVTAPINKENIQQEGFSFPGHTEYLEDKFSTAGEKSLMILASGDLRVALVTGHIPLSQVSENITVEKIKELTNILNETLKNDFRILQPKIAVLGLNPHAGEHGLLGSEEENIIIPAIKELQNEGILAFGPFPADGFFGSSQFKQYDAVLAMYHDQGLAPFKALAMDSGVNYTAGLPVIRTSPAHGTAFSIAGKGIASEDSFRQAIFMAIDAFRNRRDYFEMYKNPLQKLYVERGNDNVELDLTSDDDDTL